MATHILPQVQFRTVTEVRKLLTWVFPSMWRIRDSPRADGLGNKDDLGYKVRCAHGEFYHIAADLKKWHKTQPASYTRTGKLDGWLRANGVRISTALNNLEHALVEFSSHFCPEDTHTWAFIQDAWSAMDEMWRLDLSDTEAREIERMNQRLQSADELREKRAKDKAWTDRKKRYLEYFETLPEEGKVAALRVVLLHLAEVMGKKLLAPKPKPELVQPEVEPELEPLDAADLINALDEAFANQGVE